MTNRNDWNLGLSVHTDVLTPEKLMELAALGIHDIELCSAYFEQFDEIDFIHKSRDIVAMAKEYGVTISSVHLPFYPFGTVDPADHDPEHRMITIEKQGALIRAAGEAGIPLCVIHPSGEPYPEIERTARLERALALLAVLSGIAYVSGTTLCIENIPRTCLCRDSGEMRYLLDRIPTLRACFDTNHCLGEDNAHFVRALGDKIVTLHVSDYDFANERHWLPGQGKNNWDAILGALEEVDYKGRFLYETDRCTFAEVAENHRMLMNKGE